jgi:5-methyltetrahydrofolate--homocysteine methyltransferase
MVDLIKIKDSVIEGEVDEVRDMVKRAIDEGQEAKRILNEALLPGMSIVGDKFEEGEFFLPEMLIAAMAMKEGLEVLSPVLTQSDMKAAGTVVMGTAKGDIHDVGKSIVGVMLEGAGFMVTDIGVDVGPDKFVEAAKENNADIIGVSALLTTTIMGMKDVIKAMKEAGGYAPDAPSAVKRAKELV